MEQRSTQPIHWTKQGIPEALAQQDDKLRQLGVIKIGLFGSYSRDEERLGSDIDLLVTLESSSFDQYTDLLFFLDDLFGCKVDLVPEKHLKPQLRPYVLENVIYAQGL